MLVSSAVDRGLEPRSGQTVDYKIGICCFSSKHVTLRRKSKDWLDCCFCLYNYEFWLSLCKIVRSSVILLLPLCKNPTGSVGLVQVDLIIISLKITLFSPWYSWKIAELALNLNHYIVELVLILYITEILLTGQ